jgi:thioredoxin-related protein
MHGYTDPTQLVSNESEILVLILSRKNCQESQRFKSDFDQVSLKLDFLNLRWVICDIDIHPHMAKQFSVEETPTFLFSTNNQWQGQINHYNDADSFVLQITKTFSGC